MINRDDSRHSLDQEVYSKCVCVCGEVGGEGCVCLQLARAFGFVSRPGTLR